ncbi:MFS transporter [Penicillium cosmopolitanum]|uniref:MFS transporter n=1 Tax=Penicillium cosmopolitanum TaxID=1131564 RepID=A0A9W9S0W4_9EURO|nr:MFS transporter [Penicillium cosmopolitanum]KAJ5369662.1 MFS transporter [Penicillium cosmopolitanum]
MARVLDDHYHTAPMPLHTFLDPPEEEDDLELQRFDSHRQHFDPLDYDTKPILAEEPISPDSPNPTTARGKSTEEVSYAKLVPLTICLCLATFCLSLDGTILATAIPKITNSFNSLDDVGWYGSSFLFTNCTVQLFFGKLYTFYSAKWVFLSGLGIFEIGSLVCAIAPNSVSLIIGRAIAGIGAAGLFSGAIIIIANTVPLRIRPIYIGILSSMHSIASVAGPILGGAFTDHLTWRWCFWINLPLGGLTAIGIFFLMPTRAGDVQPLPWKEQVKQFDLPGTLTMIPSIICLLLALQWGGSKYDWKNARIIVLMILFALLFAAFVGIQIWQKDRATVPVRLMKNRSVFGAAWYACCISAPMFVVAYYLPIWFQAIKGVSATTSGIDNLPSIVVFAIIAGVLASVIGYYTPFVLISSVLTAIAAGMLSTLNVNSGMPEWFGYQVLLAAGVGFGVQNVMLVSQVAVDAEDMAIATSILTFVQTLGGTICLSVAESVFQNRLIKNLLSSLSKETAALVLSGGATGFRSSVPKAQLPPIMAAYNDAVMQALYVAVATGSISILGPIFMEWISIKEKPKTETPEKDGQTQPQTRAEAVKTEAEIARRRTIRMSSIGAGGRLSTLGPSTAASGHRPGEGGGWV